jgi:hypothetical protein
MVAGSAVLVFGLSAALGILLLLQSIWPSTLVGWAFGVPLAIVSLFFGLILVLGGRKLRGHGARRQRTVELEAARAAIAHRNGMITAAEAARALDVTEEYADALLTELSRDTNVEVNLEFEDDGRVRYVFDRPAERFRVLEERAALAGEEPLGEVGVESAAARAFRRSER